jgi:hypothetical protein
MKDNEIYAPNFRNGERVVLIRHPHAGTFEIPELRVNNNHPEAKALLGPDTQDVVGINAKVAQHLSGADFDGDAVLVIPNTRGLIKRTAPLAALQHFDPVTAFPAYDGMPEMLPRTKQKEMGVISNLITDMTLRDATPSELARAVRHSMVVIDAEKKHLNYKESARANGISELKARYQSGGASTLISRAKGRAVLPQRKIWTPRDTDPNTGEKIYRYTGEKYPVTTTDKRTGVTTTKMVDKTTISKKLAEAKDAHTLVSDAKTPMEKVYADHSNRLKALANQARKESYHTPPITKDANAKKVYANEVQSLDAKLNIALKNAPLERQAQLAANVIIRAKKEANPDMDDDEMKKVRWSALKEARIRTGAGKEAIDITPGEWNAIQAGAVAPSKLSKILNNADLEQVKKLATPKTQTLMTSTKLARAKGMADSGYTQAEIADALGVSLTTLKNSLKGGG